MLDYGIEIECLANTQTQQSIAAAITAAGVECYAAGYSHTFERTRWKVVSDGSLHGGTGFELVSPPLTEAGFDQITKVCETLATLGATINRTCGLHVHIGARAHSIATMKKLAALYIEHEPVIDTLLPASRRGSANQYCQSITAANIEQLKNAASVTDIARAINHGNRYVKLNFNSFWRHGTVEFRHHSGTIDAVKIIKWIVLCSKLVEVAAQEADTPITLVAPGQAQSGQVQSYASAYWRRGHRARILYMLLCRPEGVTSTEFRTALGTRSRDSIRWHLRQAGVSTNSIGRRMGAEIFRIDTSAPVRAEATQPPTLEGLYTKLGLSDEDKLFWAARAAALVRAPTVAP